MKRSLIVTPLFVLCSAACGVRSAAPDQRGIDAPRGDAGEVNAPATHLDAGLADAAAVVGGDAARPQTPIVAPKARGFYVYSLEYNSSASVGALGLTGEVLSKSLISSGSELPGLSLGLGTDIVPPTQPQTGRDIVLIDRSNHAVDWLDVSSAEVTQQVGVGPGGFAANPYDYLLVHPELALVSRFETNGSPGDAELDEGGDLLAINPKTGNLLGRVDFNELTRGEEDLQPRPTKLVEGGGLVYVVLGMLTSDWTPVQESVLAVVDPDELELNATLGLGLRNCEDVALTPSGDTLAVACKGGWADDPVTKNSGIVLVDLTGDVPRVKQTYGAAELADAQIGTLDFANDSLLVFSSYGNFDPAANDAARSLNVDDGRVSEPIFETTPYQLGHIRCVADERVCVLANADDFAVEFFAVTSQGLEHARTVEFDADLGLPPRYIGVF